MLQSQVNTFAETQVYEEVEVVTDPLLEIAWRYEVATDEMQVARLQARLLERLLRNTFRADHFSAHADRLVQNLKADLWKWIGFFPKTT